MKKLSDLTWPLCTLIKRPRATTTTPLRHLLAPLDSPCISESSRVGAPASVSSGGAERHEVGLGTGSEKREGVVAVELPLHEESHVGPYGVETPLEWEMVGGEAGAVREEGIKADGDVVKEEMGGAGKGETGRDGT